MVWVVDCGFGVFILSKYRDNFAMIKDKEIMSDFSVCYRRRARRVEDFVTNPHQVGDANMCLRTGQTGSRRLCVYLGKSMERCVRRALNVQREAVLFVCDRVVIDTFAAT